MLEKHGFSKNKIVFLRSQPSLSDDQDPKKLPSWGLPGVTMGQRQGGGGKGGDPAIKIVFSRSPSRRTARPRRGGGDPAKPFHKMHDTLNISGHIFPRSLLHRLTTHAAA